MKLKDKFINSSKELSSGYSLAAIAMMLAVRVVVGIFANYTLMLTSAFKININFIPLAVTAVLYGPVNAAIVGGLGDILSIVINPIGGVINPGITLNEILAGLILGIFLYKNNVSVKNVIISWTIIAVVLEIFLKSFWLYFFTFRSGFELILITRVIGELIIFVPAVMLIYLAGKAAGRIKLK